MRKYLLTLCLACCSGLAVAQDTTYSTDALIATFKRGSSVSLKGTQVTLTGTVIGLKKSNIVFKSSENDRVICELNSPVNNEHAAVGQSLTVVGKVRGRGMLGNVTLDGCSVASTVMPSTATKIDNNVSQEVVAEPAASADPPAEPPVESENAVAPAALSTAASNQTASVIVRKPPIKIPADPLPGQLPTKPEIPHVDDPATPAQPTVASPTNGPLLRRIVIGVAAIALLFVLVKVVAAVSSRRKSVSLRMTDQARRQALEQLLAKETRNAGGRY